MPLSQIVNNIGVGKVEGTFNNLTTTLAFYGATATPFLQAQIDLQHNACTLVASNMIAHTENLTTTIMPLFGAVLAVSEDTVAGKAQPLRCAMLSHGFAEMQGTTGHTAKAFAIPLANQSEKIGQCANGCVALNSTTWASGGGVRSRGMLTEIFDTDRCVVVF